MNKLQGLVDDKKLGYLKLEYGKKIDKVRFFGSKIYSIKINNERIIKVKGITKISEEAYKKLK